MPAELSDRALAWSWIRELQSFDPTRAWTSDEPSNDALVGELAATPTRVVIGSDWIDSGSAALLATNLAKTVLGATPRQRIEFVRACVDKVAEFANLFGPPKLDQFGFDYRYAGIRHRKEYPHAAMRLSLDLLRKRLPFDAEDMRFICMRMGDLGFATEYSVPLIPKLIRVIELHVAAFGTSESLNRQIERFCTAIDRISNAPERKLITRLTKAMNGVQFALEGGEAWADAAIADMHAAKSRAQQWAELMQHCAAAKSAAPSAKWLKRATKLIEEIGHDAVKSRITAWLPLIDQPRTTRPITGWHWGEGWEHFITDGNADALRGLAWCCSLSEDAELARMLTKLAISAYRKLPGIGPRLVKVGNAAVWALGNMPGLDAVGQLAIVKTRVKFGTAQKLIQKAFDVAARRAGLPVDEIEEMAVPTYGLESVGRRTESFGDYSATLTVESADAVAIQWQRADGKPLKTAPAAVKTQHADDWKELSQAAKDLQRMLPAQRERLDSMMLAQRSWSYETWRARYLDHPLVGVLARRLIWTLTTAGLATHVIAIDDKLRDVHGDAVIIDAATTVELWHPIGKTIGQVLSWRERLEACAIRQPFKQGHREVYVLTDAERNTRTYSNRFAAHVLRQHQFNALCAARGWKNPLRLYVDQDFPPATRLLPKWNLRAEFWIDGIGENYGTDINETGVFHRVSTDQVRFYPLDAAQNVGHGYGGGYAAPRDGAVEPLPLDSIPPLVFSEVMRDVDLFVGVASVGNDPTWSDGGPEGRFVDYWRDYAFGTLGETAITRKAVLEKLIPRLAIADRCSFADKFLVVRGDIRTYRIHLGSANILMEPNDQYLCIVPSRGAGAVAGGRVFLPFEGDERLSVIVSKAIMLAADTKIADPSIVSQIRAG